MTSLSGSRPQSGSAPTSHTDPLTPAPLLDAFENFEGSFFDLDHNIRVAADDIKRLRTTLREQMQCFGLQKGDRLITAAPNGPWFGAVWAASLECGASPILVHSQTPDAELRRIAKEWGARFVIAPATEGGGTESHWLTDGTHGTLRWQRIASERSYDNVLALSAVPLHPTSGTSGSSKLAVRPGPCAVAEPLHYIETLSLHRRDVVLCALPMSHAYAYGMCFMVALLTSAELLYMRCFDPRRVSQALGQRNVSVFPTVPVLLETLLAEGAATSIGRPRIVLSAGAPLSKETVEACRNRWGVNVRPLYGTTETGGISIGSHDRALVGSVGQPMKGVLVDLQGSRDTGFEAGTGVLRVCSTSMMHGYLERHGVNRTRLADGWFETGDLARLDEKGEIHLLGRLSEVINIFGFKVTPSEVEEVIAMLPEVSEVKVYRGSWRGQSIVKAAVACRQRIKEETILKHCAKHLVSYKCPSAITFVDSLPRTASGKVAVDRLQE